MVTRCGPPTAALFEFPRQFSEFCRGCLRAEARGWCHRSSSFSRSPCYEDKKSREAISRRAALCFSLRWNFTVTAVVAFAVHYPKIFTHPQLPVGIVKR